MKRGHMTAGDACSAISSPPPWPVKRVFRAPDPDLTLALIVDLCSSALSQPHDHGKQI